MAERARVISAAASHTAGPFGPVAPLLGRRPGDVPVSLEHRRQGGVEQGHVVDPQVPPVRVGATGVESVSAEPLLEATGPVELQELEDRADRGPRIGYEVLVA